MDYGIFLTLNNSGYAKLPEPLRWKGKLAALYLRLYHLMKSVSILSTV